MNDVLTNNRDINQYVKRNIVSLRISQDLFDDLTDGDPALTHLAQQLEQEVKKDIPSGIINRSFHYTTAIEFPFASEPYLRSRYGDGSYAVWYASLDLETTIHETAYHMMREQLKIEGLKEIVYQERAVYDVHCRALLVDLTDKRWSHPALVAPDYAPTQQIGKRLQREGHPGLLAPSARAAGNNVAIFRKDVLSDPKVVCYLNYLFDPTTRRTVVERQPGTALMHVEC